MFMLHLSAVSGPSTAASSSNGRNALDRASLVRAWAVAPNCSKFPRVSSSGFSFIFAAALTQPAAHTAQAAVGQRHRSCGATRGNS